MVYGLVTEKGKDHQSKLQKLVSFRDFTTKYGIRGTYASKKEESEGKDIDVPYMTPAWTKATRAKCRFSKRFSQIRTP